LGEASRFSQLAELAESLAAEPGRLKKRAAIAEALFAAHEASGGDDAGRLCLYLAGQPFAEADPRKLSVGGALLTRAVKEVSGCSDAELSAAYRRHGDLGAAAAEVWEREGRGKREEGRDSLTLQDVEEAFAAIASARSTAARSALVQGMLRRAAALEAKYLLKLMLGDMRIGVKQSLIEEAIAAAAESELSAVRHAVMLEADLARVVGMAFAGTLGAARMRLFHPLGFMLASPVDSPEEAMERFGEALLEDKYDGMRAQIHCGDPQQPGRVAVYSRTREDITESFPELVEAFRACSAAGDTAMILDGEVLGWEFGQDAAEGKALPFAQLGQRIGRKRVDNALRRQVPVVFMAFDVLFEGDELLLGLPLQERRARLEALSAKLAPLAVSALELDATAASAQAELFAAFEPVAQPVPRWLLSPAQRVESAEQIDQAYRDARARANEGVMLKAADSAYQPGRRGLSWAKLKRELATLDVVITGAEFGHGRRAGLLSDYTFAVRGPSVGDRPGELLNVGKAYSGLTDAEIAEMTAWLQDHTLEDHGHVRTVEPLRVLEVAFNNVMRSDRHASGFALRFPRILRVRDDKPVEEIDTLERVEAVFHSQPDKSQPKGGQEPKE
jgi:DNA ligase-1